MFVTYRHTNIQTNIHTYIQTLWLLESLDLLDRETKNNLLKLYNREKKHPVKYTFAEIKNKNQMKP